MNTLQFVSRDVFGASLLLLIALAGGAGSVQAQKFIEFNPPQGTNCGPNLINNLGALVGGCYVANGLGGDDGFVLQHGQYISLNFPGSIATVGGGINDEGQIVGGYLDSANAGHGFLLSNETYSAINYPGAITTVAESINNIGAIVGLYYNLNDPIEHGFLLKGGIFSTLDDPEAARTVPNQINNMGVIAGWYVDTSSAIHGYTLANGIYTSINFPGASQTLIQAISDSNEMSGVYTIGANTFGFTYLNGVFTTINFPLGIVANLAVNNAGQLGVFWGDSGGNYHGAVSAIGPFAYFGYDAVTVLDTSTNLVLTSIPVGMKNAPVALSSTHLYIADNVNALVDVIDTTTDILETTIPVGRGATAVALTPDFKTGYVANSLDNTVSVFSTASNSVLKTIPVGVNPEGEYMSADGALDYDYEQGTGISVIDTATNTVAATISIPELNGMAFTPNGEFAYLTPYTSLVNPGSVTVLAVPSNAITASIRADVDPGTLAITPDGGYLYVPNYGSKNVSVIDTRTNRVIDTVAVGNQPFTSAITPDGAYVYVGNLGDSTFSIIQTATNNVIATIPASPNSITIAISAAPPTSQTITQPLSPTAPNTFNFGPHNFTVQYPSGTSFSNVNMTVVAAQANQQTFKQRVAGTQFANATCIVYSGAGGNCVDYQVTCSSANGGTISCPSESSPTISVKTSFDTQQQIINPGFLTTPIGENDWTNIFESFYLQRIDPTVKGRTRGFSEFVAVDLGASNEQGAGNATLLAPLAASDDRIFPSGTTIPVQFSLVSIAHPGTSVTDATAGISVVQTADSKGNAVANIVLDAPTGFAYSGSSYKYSLKTSGYAAGTYVLTIYGNAFAAQQVQFTIPAATSGAHLVTTLQSLTLNSSTNQYVATISIANTGTSAANGVLLTAAKLNTTATSTALPLGVGDISAASSITATLTFPTSAGAAGSPGSLSISETYAGGSTGAGVRVVLP